MKKNLIVLLFLASLFSPSHLHSQKREPAQLFARAYTLFSQGNFSQAEEPFRETLSGNFPLEDYSLYFLALISLNRGDPDDARSYLARLNERFPQSIWSSQAELQSAKISLAAKDYPRAMTELKSLRARGPKKEISDEALFLTGELHEAAGDLSQAHSAFQELRRASPLSPWAARARKKAHRLREREPQLFGATAVDAQSEEAQLLFRERDYEAAERAYRKLLDLVPTGALRPRPLLGLANVYREARKREEAIPLLAEIAREYPESPEAPRALNFLARIYWNRDENAKALEHFKQLKERYPKSALLDVAEISSARIYESLGKPGDAQAIYQAFSRRFPDSPLRQEAQWRLAWLYYLQADFSRAHAAFRNVAAEKGGEYKTGALYWQARSAARMDAPSQARQIFLQIVGGQEESYYSGAAAKWLEKMGQPFEEKSPAPLPPQPAPSLAPEPVFHFSRAEALAQLALNQLAVAELDEITNLAPGDSPLKMLLVREYARNQAYARSVDLANQIVLPADELNRYRYPLAYWDEIRKIAADRGLDPYLVLALIRQESLFDPKALSPASAFGLMQLLPSTAARAAAQLGVPAPSPQRLFEPELNLTLGIHHLKELLQRYPNNLVKAIAAYNAGENAVARWEKQIAAEDDDEFIERIPYGETRLYVKLVLRNHRIYRKIYDVRK